MPGTAKTFSTTKEPVKRLAANGPKTVITGIKAFLSACFNITVDLDKPFDLAVIIYSEFKTSTNSVLVKRATLAIVKNDSAIEQPTFSEASAPNFEEIADGDDLPF